MMHIASDTKYVSYTCDICEEDFDPYEKDMNKVLELAKAEGWQVSHTNDKTSHFCPACVEKYKD